MTSNNNKLSYSEYMELVKTRNNMSYKDIIAFVLPNLCHKIESTNNQSVFTLYELINIVNQVSIHNEEIGIKLAKRLIKLAPVAFIYKELIGENTINSLPTIPKFLLLNSDSMLKQLSLSIKYFSNSAYYIIQYRYKIDSDNLSNFELSLLKKYIQQTDIKFTQIRTTINPISFLYYLIYNYIPFSAYLHKLDLKLNLNISKQVKGYLKNLSILFFCYEEAIRVNKIDILDITISTIYFKTFNYYDFINHRPNTLLDETLLYNKTAVGKIIFLLNEVSFLYNHLIINHILKQKNNV